MPSATRSTTTTPIGAKLVETAAPLLRLGDPVQNALENILFRRMLVDLQIQHDFTGIANAAVTCLGGEMHTKIWRQGHGDITCHDNALPKYCDYFQLIAIRGKFFLFFPQLCFTATVLP